ncbi:MAG TPA: hypothetical protein VMG58_02435, partial [Candidatus Sulfotelmatobacter sp.]|nr:hypothetical protein [Candidatus Sulfotelmatobacter sp.]
LVLGDSAGAADLMLQVLDNIQMAPTLLIDEPLQSASLVRVMALAAELSARRGDGAAARRWATRVIQLWSDCDATCQPVVSRMRSLLN